MLINPELAGADEIVGTTEGIHLSLHHLAQGSIDTHFGRGETTLFRRIPLQDEAFLEITTGSYAYGEPTTQIGYRTHDVVAFTTPEATHTFHPMRSDRLPGYSLAPLRDVKLNTAALELIDKAGVANVEELDHFLRAAQPTLVETRHVVHYHAALAFGHAATRAETKVTQEGTAVSTTRGVSVRVNGKKATLNFDYSARLDVGDQGASTLAEVEYYDYLPFPASARDRQLLTIGRLTEVAAVNNALFNHLTNT